MSLEPAANYKKYDTETPEFKKRAAMAIAICIALGLIGGLTLGHKISEAEKAHSQYSPQEVQKAKEDAAKRKIMLRNRRAGGSK